MQTILFQGDSITDARRSRDTWDDEEYRGSGYATMVTAQLTRNAPGAYKCVNRGISGNRISDILARMRCDVEQLQPDVMSLLIGVNDVWHEVNYGNGVPAERFERMLDLLLGELSQSLPHTRVMLLEPFVLEGFNTCATEEKPGRWEAFRTGVPQRARAVERMAGKYGCVFIPLQKQLDALAAQYGPQYWLFDGVHPTAAGHQVIAEAWLKGFASLT